MPTETQRRRPVPVAWYVAGAAILVWLCHPLLFGGNSDWALVVPLGTAAIAAALTVWAVRSGRQQRRRYEARIAALAADGAAQAERLRLARDLHDLVSHNIGLVTVRAANALHVGDPADEREALRDVERIGRTATHELRRMLRVLRQPDSSVGSTMPTDSFDALPALVDAARDSGLAVTLDLDQEPDVSAVTQLAVCKVVREGLANVARHAGPCSVMVSVRLVDGWWVTTVHDSGGSADWQVVPGSGFGLRALREQIVALGGELTTRDAGGQSGFELRARIPDQDG